MDMQETFQNFNHGALRLPETNQSFDNINWSKHPTFEGVELKHIITGKDTNGVFSYHLVRIAPGKSIFNHTHETQLETHEIISGSGFCMNNGVKLEYSSGIISIFSIGVLHEVTASADGLFLFAKFIPALC